MFVNRLLRTGMHVLITGSNTRLLSGELATHLTGRHMKTELYPFSFSVYERSGFCLRKIKFRVRDTQGGEAGHRNEGAGLPATE